MHCNSAHDIIRAVNTEELPAVCIVSGTDIKDIKEGGSAQTPLFLQKFAQKNRFSKDSFFPDTSLHEVEFNIFSEEQNEGRLNFLCISLHLEREQAQDHVEPSLIERHRCHSV